MFRWKNRWRKIAKSLGPKEIVSFEELLQRLYPEAVINLLEAKGIIQKEELLEEIKRLKEKNKKREIMSKHETPMTEWYWQQVGGTLVEEFVAIEGTSTCGRRVLDGVIIKEGEFRIAKQNEVSLEGKDIIVAQRKASRLGMYLMG